MSGSIFQAATEVSIGERDGQVIVTFLRTGDLSSPINITYDVTSESATPGADFTGGSGTVLMAAGASSTTVTFPIINDTLSESTETFIVSLAAVDSGEISLPRTVRVNILDDENPVVPPASPPLASDYRVIKETVVSDLNQPIKFEFSPVNPDLAYVADKAGVISLVNFATGAEVGTVLDIRSLVNENNDRGLFDIAFHPDFENNPYMYAFYVVEPPDATPEMQDTVGNRYAYVVRYTLDASENYQQIVPGSEVILLGGAGQSTADISGGGTLNFSSPAYSNLPSSERYLDPAGGDTVIDGIKQDYIKVDSITHVGGSLTFGPDGMLYISIGDGGSPNYADPHNADVQNLNSTSGKILRVDPLTGDGLTDNPFFQSGMSLDSNIAKVYQYGLRNPFSMGFDSLGRLTIADTGWNGYEEIDTGPGSTNFGWPWYEGREGGVLAKTSGYQSLPPAAAFYAGVENGTIHVAAPYNAFGHAESAPGFQNQVITGGDVIYTGGRYPVEFQGDYFFTNFFNGSTFVIDTNNRLDVKFLFPSEGQYAPVHFIQGADGYVYYTELFGPNFSAGSMGRLHIFDEDDNLLVNGSFEQPVVPVGSSNFGTVPGWTALSGGRIEIWKAHNNVVASDGTNFLELDYVAGQDGFFQDIQTQAGETYTLAFDLRTRLPERAITTQAVEILWNDGLVDTVTPTNATWESVVVPLIGTGGLDRLTIREVAAQGGDGWGAMLDHFGLYSTGDAAPAPSSPPAPNLFVNGSFEQPILAAGSASSFASVAGWTAIAGGKIEIWNAHNGVFAHDGVNFLELDYLSARDGFSQSVQTTAAQTYELSFDLRTRLPERSTSTQGVEVVWNGIVIETIAPTSATWTTRTFDVVGTGGLDTLTIREVASQGTDGWGAMLDNFSLFASDPSANAPPIVSDPVDDQHGQVGEVFSFVVPTGTFTDPDGDSLTYSATLIGGSALPAWLSFNSSTRTFSGTPPATGILQVQVTANDGEASITDVFALDIGSMQSNLLINGSFEQPLVPIGGSSNFNAVAGWTAISGGKIEIWNAHNGVTASNGANFLELDFFSARDGFSQSVQTAAGQTYELSFDLRTRLPARPTSTQGVEVVWNGVVIETIAPTGATWSTRTFDVLGTGGLDTLTIREVASQGTDGWGAMLDDFSLTATDAPPPYPANLLVNGSFEQPTVPLGGSSNFDSVAGWTAISGGKIEIWNAHNAVVASNGANFLELDFLSARDGFSQSVQTAAGQTYELSFDLRTRLPARPTSTQGVEVVWNGVVIDTIAPTSATWSTRTFDVLGTGGLDTLTIREVASQGTDGWGAMLDDFSLIADSGTPATLLSFANQTDRAKVVDLGEGLWTNAARVLPLGDSNTHGWSSLPQDQWEGYRLDLWTLAAQDNLWFDYVGSSASGPKALPDRNHQGVSGITSTQVVGLSTQIANTHQPDVVLLMLGTNDALRETNAANTVPGELLQIMQNIAAAQPGATILLAPLPPIDPAQTSFLPNADTIRAEINAQLPNVVTQAQASGIAAVFVPMSNLTTGDLTDGIHLTDAGHAKIAAAWYNALLANISTVNGTFGGQPISISGIVDVHGSELGDGLRGNAAANAIDGRGGADRIEGMGGADQLTGGPGADTFVYKAPNEGGDTITDFISVLANALTSDTLSISASGFGGGLAPGGIVNLAQSSVPVAAGSNGQLLFDTDDGRLLWDGDGAGASAPVLVVRLLGVTSLSANDFLIIA
jgi:glucose/arabinose dehydrogenase/lysophospholipase L1-like esterase